MADQTRAIRSVAVLGGGIVGLSAALAFRNALPEVEVTVIETPPNPAALADRLTTAWPSIHRFHARIGLGERDVLRSGAATPLLGTRIDPALGSAPWYLVHGQCGVPVGSVPFHQIWARGWREGRARPYGDHSAAAVLAAADRFVHPEEDPRSPLSTYQYGLRLDPARYSAVLAGLADRAGLGRVSGALAGVTRHPDGKVATVVLDDGQPIAADLFLDCAGPQAPLLAALGETLRDWRNTLPVDQMVLSEHPAAPVGSCDTASATPTGWAWTVRLPDRELRGRAFNAGKDRPADAGHYEIVRLTHGWRTPWRHNVLAIGDAAIAAPPVPGVHLHLAHLAIELALDLLPGRDCDASETSEYNRRAARQAERLLDFLALFQPGATTERLAQTIDLFVRRGHLVTVDDDAIPRDLWIAALIGQGHVPGPGDALATAVDAARGDALLADLSRGLATLPGQLPDYASYLRAWMR